MMQSLFFGCLARCCVVLGALLTSAAAAQSLSAEPWPPQNDRTTTLSGSGFKPNAEVRLEFDAPVPTLDGSRPVPGRVPTDASGAFRLELTVRESRLSATAVNGALRASVRRDPPPLEYAADGTTVIARDANRVVARYYLSGPVRTLERSLNGYRAVVRSESGLEESFTLENARVVERVVFSPSSALLQTLRAPTFVKQRIDNAVSFWRERSERDPTNPFVRLEWGAAALRAGDSNGATLMRQALEVNAPFYVFVGLASRFEDLRQTELAQGALERAKRAFAAAGYDPGFPISKEALAAFGDPLGEARRLFAAQNPVRGAAWLEYVRATTPRFPGYNVVYGEFASYLEGQGRSAEGADWRRLSAELDAGTTYGLGDQGFTRLEAFGALGLALTLACYLLLQFVLMLKYYPQQTRDLQSHGGRFGATSRAPLVRLRHSLIGYQTITEKLIGVLLLVGSVGVLGVWQYARQGGEFVRSSALGLGTAGGAAYFQSLSNVPSSGNAFLTGLGAQLDGDTNRALESYEAAGSVAGARNNAGTIWQARGDTPRAQSEFSQALEIDPNLMAAKLNLGNAAEGYRVAFHNAFRKGLPMLETFSPRELAAFRFGVLEQEFVRMSADPWAYLSGLPLPIPDWARGVVAVLILALLAWAVLWLFVPRVRTAATAPRSILYHFGAIAVPGSGLADEVWGVLLLVPAAVLAVLIGLDSFASTRLESLFASASFLGIGRVGAFYDINANLQWLWVALAAIYAVNFIGWVVETRAVNRRRRLQTAPVQKSP
jgi:tetratricopeptide (TPR) repeat protein